LVEEAPEAHEGEEDEPGSASKDNAEPVLVLAWLTMPNDGFSSAWLGDAIASWVDGL
jgi:hypothetical protein